MKPSKYNYIFYQKPYSYWFNGVTRDFFRLGYDTGKKMEELLSTPDQIEKEVPSLFASLKKFGFLVPEEDDELGLVRKINENQTESDAYYLVVLPTLNCNYRCWYCIQDHIESKMSKNTINRVQRHIDYIIDVKKINRLRMEFFGGEPLMYF